MRTGGCQHSETGQSPREEPAKETGTVEEEEGKPGRSLELE